MAGVSSFGIRIEWMQQSNAHSWSLTEPDEWRSYSDIEISIIDKVYQKKRPEVMLDDYHINSKQSVQISNNNQTSQCPVKRAVAKERGESCGLREYRFMPSPLNPSAPFQSSPTFFIDEVERYFNVDELCNELGLSTVLQIMVEKAGIGLIVEGKKAGKQKVAESMAEELLEVKKGTRQEITARCARLYSSDSFLYRRLNECMRLVGDEEYEQLWKQKARTLGPFAWLLECLENPFTDQKTIVYRSANLSDDLIEKFRQAVGVDYKAINFPAFTSTSRNREKVEWIGSNVLFAININEDEVRDLAPHSIFDEEAMLILPYIFFTIVSCYFDETIHKWVIHLKSARA